MGNTKITYKQFCTHLDRNVIYEKTIYENGEINVVCTESKQESCREECKNKLNVK